MQRCCLARRSRPATVRQRRGAASRPRFYKHTSIDRDGDAWRVTLDARPLPTPAGQALRLPSQRLALAIAAEWDAQIDRIEPASMPLMALASTAIDQIPKEREQTEKNILAYAATDTCRFVADAAREPEVRRRQDKYHEPILAWLRERHGADLIRGAPGMLRAPPTPPEALDALTTACAALSNYHLAALQAATFESKSIAIGLALLGLHIDAEDSAAVRLTCHESLQLLKRDFFVVISVDGLAQETRHRVGQVVEPQMLQRLLELGARDHAIAVGVKRRKYVL